MGNLTEKPVDRASDVCFHLKYVVGFVMYLINVFDSCPEMVLHPIFTIVHMLVFTNMHYILSRRVLLKSSRSHVIYTLTCKVCVKGLACMILCMFNIFKFYVRGFSDDQ